MKYKPMPGRAIIEPEDRFDEGDYSGLILPDYVKGRKKAVATIIDWAPGRPHKCQACHKIQHIAGPCIWCNCKTDVMSSKPASPIFDDLKGQRVIYLEVAVQHLSDNLFAVPIDHVLAIVHGGGSIGGADDASGVQRCKFCGPAKASESKNAMMMVKRRGRMMCPRCKKDQYGKNVDLNDA